jgi:hypothetical protein
MQLIPDDMEFQSGDVPNYTTSDGSVCFLSVISYHGSSHNLYVSGSKKNVK